MERLAERLAAQERMLAYLESLIQRKEGIMPYDVQIVDVSPQLVAGHQIHTTRRKIGDDIGRRLRIADAGARARRASAVRVRH